MAKAQNLTVTVSVTPVVSVSNGGETVTMRHGNGVERGNTRIDFRQPVPYRRNQRGELLTPTSCLVNGKQGMGFDRADCSPHDVFSVDIGRKLALSRALEHFPREFREEVWKAVFETGVIRQ